MAEYSEEFEEEDATYGDDDFDDIDDEVPSAQASAIEYRNSPLPASPPAVSVAGEASSSFGNPSSHSTDSISEGMEALRARAGGAAERGQETDRAAGRRPAQQQESRTLFAAPSHAALTQDVASASERSKGSEMEKKWREEADLEESRQLAGYGKKPIASPEMPPPQPKPPRQKTSQTPPMTPALMTKAKWCVKLEARAEMTQRLQRVLRGHFARRAWTKPLDAILRWRKSVARQAASVRRPMLVHILPTQKKDEGWLGDAKRPHMLVPIGCPDTVKWFPNTNAIKAWWYAVPDKIRRLFDTSHAEVLPRWDDEPKELIQDRDPGPGAYTVKKTEVLQPRVTGGNFPRAKRFAEPSVGKKREVGGKGRDSSNSNTHLPVKIPGGSKDISPGAEESPAHKTMIPRLKLPRGEGEGSSEHMDVSIASARINKSIARAESQAAEYKQHMEKLAERQREAHQRIQDKEEVELQEARDRIKSLKKDNTRHLARMRQDLSNPRHPLYGYGNRFTMAFVSPRVAVVGARGWRGDKAPAWATFHRNKVKGLDGAEKADTSHMLTEALAPLSERGRAGMEKRDFFSLLATISETKKEAINRKGPQASQAAVALASKYEGIGAKFAALDESADHDEALAFLPEEGWSSPEMSPRSPKNKKGASPKGASPAHKDNTISPHAAAAEEGQAGCTGGDRDPQVTQRLGPKTPGKPLQARARPAYLGADRRVPDTGAASSHALVQRLVEAPPTDLMLCEGAPSSVAPHGKPTARKPFLFAKKGPAPIGTKVEEAITMGVPEGEKRPTFSHLPFAHSPPVAVVALQAEAEKPVDLSKMSRVQRMRFMQQQQQAVLDQQNAPLPPQPAPAPAAPSASEEPVDLSKISRVQRMKYMQEHQDQRNVPPPLQPDAAPAAQSDAKEPVDFSKMSRVQRMKYMQEQQAAAAVAAAPESTVGAERGRAGRARAPLAADDSDDSSSDDDVAANRAAIKASIANNIGTRRQVSE